MTAAAPIVSQRILGTEAIQPVRPRASTSVPGTMRHKPHRPKWGRSASGPAAWAWAAAASIAAVTVVGWTAYSMIDATPAGFAKAREAGTMRAAQLRPATIPADYLLAHQEYSPANVLQGVGPYLRDVAASTPVGPAVAE